MATRRYSIAHGAGLARSSVTEAIGAGIAFNAMEFTFDLAAGLTREDVLKGLELIGQYILEDQFPPAERAKAEQ